MIYISGSSKYKAPGHPHSNDLKMSWSELLKYWLPFFRKNDQNMPRFQTNPLGNFSDSNVQTGGRRLIRHGSHENSFILKPLQSVIGTGIYHQDHRNWGETSKKLTEHYHSSQHVSTIQKIYCFSARENWETVETPVDSDIMDLYGLFLLRSPSLFGAMSDLPVENPTAKDRYLCKILDLGQNSTNKKCIVDVFF